MATAAFSVSLHGAPNVQRALTVGADLGLAALCQRAAAMFSKAQRCALDALTFTFDGERVDLQASPADGRTAGTLAAGGGALVIDFRVSFRVSLLEAPDEPRALAVDADLNLAALCMRAAALFAETKHCAHDALTFTFDGKRIDMWASDTTAKLAADGGKLVIGYRLLSVTSTMPSACPTGVGQACRCQLQHLCVPHI